MRKNFLKWCLQKSGLHEYKERVFFRERGVWFCCIGDNIGFEQDGKGEEFLRPIVIIKKFNNELLWGIPTTRKNRIGKFYFNFLFDSQNSTTAILSQLKTIDAKRLKYKIGTIQEKDFVELKKRIIILFD